MNLQFEARAGAIWDVLAFTPVLPNPSAHGEARQNCMRKDGLEELRKFLESLIRAADIRTSTIKAYDRGTLEFCPMRILSERAYGKKKKGSVSERKAERKLQVLCKGSPFLSSTTRAEQGASGEWVAKTAIRRFTQQFWKGLGVLQLLLTANAKTELAQRAEDAQKTRAALDHDALVTNLASTASRDELSAQDARNRLAGERAIAEMWEVLRAN